MRGFILEKYEYLAPCLSATNNREDVSSTSSDKIGTGPKSHIATYRNLVTVLV